MAQSPQHSPDCSQSPNVQVGEVLERFNHSETELTEICLRPNGHGSASSLPLQSTDNIIRSIPPMCTCNARTPIVVDGWYYHRQAIHSTYQTIPQGFCVSPMHYCPCPDQTSYDIPSQEFQLRVVPPIHLPAHSLKYFSDLGQVGGITEKGLQIASIEQYNPTDSSLPPSLQSLVPVPPVVLPSSNGSFPNSCIRISNETPQRSLGSDTLSSLGPLFKPKESGFALWVGNLPQNVMAQELKAYFASPQLQSIFLIRKSHCGFVNYATEEACSDALKFFDGRSKNDFSHRLIVSV